MQHPIKSRRLQLRRRHRQSPPSKAAQIFNLSSVNARHVKLALFFAVDHGDVVATFRDREAINSWESEGGAVG